MFPDLNYTQKTERSTLSGFLVVREFLHNEAQKTGYIGPFTVMSQWTWARLSPPQPYPLCDCIVPIFRLVPASPQKLERYNHTVGRTEEERDWPKTLTSQSTGQ